MLCAVYGCKSNNYTKLNKDETISFFQFPQEKKLQKIWVFFCQRKDKFNIKTARICSEHFKSTDFSNKLEFEMGFAKKRILVVGAYPTIKNTSAPVITTDRSMRMEVREQKEIVSSALCTEVVPSENVMKVEEIKTETDTKNNDIEMDLELKRKEIFILQQNEIKHLKEIEFLKKELAKEQSANKNMVEKLSGIFTKGQIRKLCNGTKRQQWSEEDIAQSIALYSSSSKTYKLLRRKQFPLPAIRTIQQWTQKAKIVK